MSSKIINYKHFTYKGHRYIVYVRPWLKESKRYEFIKYWSGCRKLWERITKEEYEEDYKLYLKK